MKPGIILLAALGTASLVAVTWALTRVSSWIVNHDDVWVRMHAEGATLECGIAEAFHGARHSHLLEAELVVGGFMLVLLWHALSTTQK